jgi:D-3-phosphoglycerate dehydrogenase / 2-oxoglutarate reductase
MARPRVALTDYSFPDVDLERRELSAVEADLVVGQCRTEDDVLEVARDAEAMLCDYSPITRRVLDGCPRLRVVSEYGIGVDNVDVAAASALGIWVANVPGFCTAEVADHTLALLLAASRQIIPQDRATRSGAWSFTHAGAPIDRLSDQTLGLVGFGRIARAVCDRARVFGMRVLAWSPSLTAERAAEHGAEAVTLDRLFRESDYLSLHVPATAETRGLVGADRIAQLKPTAWLINTGRGALVDEAALLQALESGRLAGAALDVRQAEPPEPDDQLSRLPNVILTPHSAYYSRRAMAELRETAARNVVSVLRGGAPIWPVNPGITPRGAS